MDFRDRLLADWRGDITISFHQETLCTATIIISLTNTFSFLELLDGQRCDCGMISKIISEQETDSILLMREGQELRACIHLNYLENEKAVYIGMVTVSPALQNGGIGSKILAEAEKYALERWPTISKSKMTVISVRSSLIEFYKRRGYKDTGKREPFPANQRFGIPKVDNLEFCVLEKQL